MLAAALRRKIYKLRLSQRRAAKLTKDKKDKTEIVRCNSVGSTQYITKDDWFN